VDQLREQYTKDFAARSRAAFDSVGKQFEDALGMVIVDEKAPDAEKQSAAQYNEALGTLSKRAEALAFGQTTETTVSEMAHKATRFDFMVEHAVPRLVANYDGVISRQNSEIAALQAQIKELTGGMPRVGGGEGNSGGKPAYEPNHLKAAEAFFRQG
jgi:hypothetical protein